MSTQTNSQSFMEQASSNTISFNFKADKSFSENLKYCPKNDIHIYGYLKTRTSNEYNTDILFLHTNLGVYHTTCNSFIDKFNKLINTKPNVELDIFLLEKISTNGNPYMGFTIS